jgi:hypothetical protein
MQPIARQLQQLDYNNENGGVFCVIHCDPNQGVILKTFEATQSVEILPVKRGLGGWCEMATSLGGER